MPSAFGEPYGLLVAESSAGAKVPLLAADDGMTVAFLEYRLKTPADGIGFVAAPLAAISDVPTFKLLSPPLTSPLVEIGPFSTIMDALLNLIPEAQCIAVRRK